MDVSICDLRLIFISYYNEYKKIDTIKYNINIKLIM